MPNLDTTGIFADKKAFTADQIPDLTGTVAYGGREACSYSS